MIQKKTVTLWTASDGSEHRTLDDVKKVELKGLFKDLKGAGALMSIFSDVDPTAQDSLYSYILEKKEKLIDILTTTEASLPKARAINGNRRPRKSKHLAAQTTIPGTGLPPEIIDTQRVSPALAREVAATVALANENA